MGLTKKENTLYLKKTALPRETDIWRGNLIEYRFPYQLEDKTWENEIQIGKITKRFPSQKNGLVGYEVIDEEGNRVMIKRYNVSKLIQR
jgi:hypothetical protein